MQFESLASYGVIRWSLKYMETGGRSIRGPGSNDRRKEGREQEQEQNVWIEEGGRQEILLLISKDNIERVSLAGAGAEAGIEVTL